MAQAEPNAMLLLLPHESLQPSAKMLQNESAFCLVCCLSVLGARGSDLSHMKLRFGVGCYGISLPIPLCAELYQALLE
jgi:hypothetical protein